VKEEQAIHTYSNEQLEQEYRLILNKQSKLPFSQRQKIITLFQKPNELMKKPTTHKAHPPNPKRKGE
jgi:hypothetical protein